MCMMLTSVSPRADTYMPFDCDSDCEVLGCGVLVKALFLSLTFCFNLGCEEFAPG
jgi:hypothetical protein